MPVNKQTAFKNLYGVESIDEATLNHFTQVA